MGTSGKLCLESQEFACCSPLSRLLAGSSWNAGPCGRISTMRVLAVMFPKVPSIYPMKDTYI